MDVVPCRSARALPVCEGDQPERRPGRARPVGPAQGDHGARDRGLHPPGLVPGAPGGAGAGRAWPVPAPGRAGPGRRRAAPGVVPRAPALPADGGGVDGVPSRRAGPADAPPAVRAGPERGGDPERPPGPARDPRGGRAPDPGHGRPGPAGGHARQRRRRLPGAGARLDAVGGRAQRHHRVRLDRGLLRGAGPPHLRGRDRPVGGPADALAGLPPRPVPGGQLLGRARPVAARPGGDGAGRRAGLLRHPPRPGDRRGVPGNGRAVPGGGQVPPERAPGVRRQPRTGRGAAGAHALPRVRQAADHGGAAAGGGPGRPPGGRPSGGGGRLPQPAAPGGGRRRGHRGRHGQQDGAADRRRHDRAARPRAAHPGASAARRHRRRRLPGGGRGDRRRAPRPGRGHTRLRRALRVRPTVGWCRPARRRVHHPMGFVHAQREDGR